VLNGKTCLHNTPVIFFEVNCDLEDAVSFHFTKGIDVLVFEDEGIHVFELVGQSRLGTPFINLPEPVPTK
jgi:hypothetical protein